MSDSMRESRWHELAKEDAAAMAIDPNPPGVVQSTWTEEMVKAFDNADLSGKRVRHSSKFSEWGTPDPMYKALDKEFRFCLDAAANKANSKHLNFFGPDHDDPRFRDALAIGSWYQSVLQSFGHVRPVFCNPPFSREEGIPIEPWIEKFWTESQAGLTIVTPIPASIQTEWWEAFVRKAHEIRIIPHRVTFNPPPGALDAINAERLREGKKVVKKAWTAGNNTAVVIWKPWTGYRPPYEAVYRYWSYR